MVDTLSIPVNYNGSIYTDEDAIKAQAETGAGGVMVARGLLANPGLFDGRLEGITRDEIISFFYSEFLYEIKAVLLTGHVET